MTEKITINSKHEFWEALQAISQIVPFFGGKWEWVSGEGESNGEMHLQLDNQLLTYEVLLKNKLTTKDVRKIAERPISSNHPTIIVSVDITDSLAKQCAEQGIAVFALNGRLLIRKPGLVIDTKVPLHGKSYAIPHPKISPFKGKSVRVARAFLSDWSREWKMTELSEFLGLSLSRISEVIRELSANDWITGARGDWRVQNGNSFLDAWAEQDDWITRGKIIQYSSLDPIDQMAEKLLKVRGAEMVFTQWFAANRRYAFTQAPVCSVYRKKSLSLEEQSQCGLQQVSKGGMLWLIIPRDSGVFQCSQRVEKYSLVSDAQIYLDLMKVGMRGPDQALALREWEGFCR